MDTFPIRVQAGEAGARRPIVNEKPASAEEAKTGLEFS